MVLQRSQEPRGTSLRAVRGDNHAPSDLTTAEVSPNTTPRRKRSHVMSAQTFQDSIAAAIWLKGSVPFERAWFTAKESRGRMCDVSTPPSSACFRTLLRCPSHTSANHRRLQVKFELVTTSRETSLALRSHDLRIGYRKV